MVDPSARAPPEEELLEELELLDELELLEELEELLLDELEEELLELEDGLPELPAPPQAISALMLKHKAPCLSSVSGLLPELAIFMRFFPLALVYS